MGDYLTARAAIAEIIGDVSITEPVATGIAAVYEGLPDGEAVIAYPSIVIMGRTLRYLRAPSKRERVYRVELQLVARQDDFTSKRQLLEALQEAVSLAFDDKLTLGLGSQYHVLEGPNWTEAVPFVDAGIVWADGEILISIKEGAAFNA